MSVQIEEIEEPRGTVAPTTVRKVDEDFKQPIKLYIATPAYGGMLHLNYVMSIINLRSQGCQFAYDVIGNESLVQRARNILTARFLKSECTHLLFVDSDIGFPPRAVQRLLEGASSGKQVLGTAYAKKSINWTQFADKVKRGDHEKKEPEPLMSLGLDYNVNLDPATVKSDDNGFVRVLDTASGFMMISRTAIQKLIDAHPEWEVVNDIEHSGGPKIDKYYTVFDCIKDPVTERLLSEDFSACRRFQELGIDVWVDFTTGLSHSGNNSFTGDITDTLKP